MVPFSLKMMLTSLKSVECILIDLLVCNSYNYEKNKKYTIHEKRKEKREKQKRKVSAYVSVIKKIF